MEDYLRDDNNELRTENGDFVRGESTRQHQKTLLITEKGSFKESPGVGVGAASFLEDEDPAGLLREIRLQFAKDGMSVNKILLNNGKLEIDANY